MSTPRTLVGVALALSVALASAHAQSPAMPDDDAFVRDVIAAINSGDVERRRELIHPAARGCVDVFTRAPLGQALRRQTPAPIGEDHRWSIRPLGRGPAGASDKASPDKAAWAVRPTHTLQLSYQTDARRRRTLIMHLVAESGRWYEVLACPRIDALPR